MPVASSELIIEIMQPSDLLAPGPSRSHARAASVLSDPSTDNDEVAPVALADVEEGDAGNSDQEDKLSEVGSGVDKIKIEDDPEDAEDNLEDAEDELEEGVQGPKLHIQDWTDLQKISKIISRNTARPYHCLKSINSSLSPTLLPFESKGCPVCR